MRCSFAVSDLSYYKNSRLAFLWISRTSGGTSLTFRVSFFQLVLLLASKQCCKTLDVSSFTFFVLDGNFDLSPENTRFERLNNLPFNAVKADFVAIFVCLVTAASFIETISSLVPWRKREAILFLFGCPKVNSSWLVTSELANQRTRKSLFTSVAYTKIERLET